MEEFEQLMKRGDSAVEDLVRRDSGRAGGFTLVEMVGAIGFLSVGLVALAGALISMSHQREQSVARSLVMAGAQALLEEIRNTTDLRNITLTYDKAKYKLKGVNGADAGNALHVSVDTTNPKLITVRLSGSWIAAGHTETMELVSQIYSYGGQKS